MGLNRIIFKITMTFIILLVLLFISFHLLISSDYPDHYRVPSFNIKVTLHQTTKNQLRSSGESLGVAVYYETTSHSYPGYALQGKSYEISSEGGFLTIPAFDLSRFQRFSLKNLINLIFNHDGIHEKIKAITLYVYSIGRSVPKMISTCPSISISQSNLAQLYHVKKTYHIACS